MEKFTGCIYFARVGLVKKPTLVYLKNVFPPSGFEVDKNILAVLSELTIQCEFSGFVLCVAS